jgi:hypothetical protein
LRTFCEVKRIAPLKVETGKSFLGKNDAVGIADGDDLDWGCHFPSPDAIITYVITLY